jgi:hypothetical protein
VPFTPEQRLRLMRAYAPVLYLHRDELFVPVSPTAYLERAALWDDAAPGSHLRESWGHPIVEGMSSPSFPRAPLLAPGQLTVEQANAGGNVHFLGEQVDGAFPFTQSDSERALFLDFGGWWEEGALPDFGNNPGEVQEVTQNRWAFIENLAVWSPWRPADPAEPAPPEVAMLEPFRRRLSADVHDWQSLSVAASQINPDLIPMLIKIASRAGNMNLWFIFYHFFYPAHEEKLPWCEFVALLNNLGKELPSESPSLQPGSPEELAKLGDLAGLHRADYAGDWSTVCIVVRAPPGLMPTAGGPQELPADDADLPPPTYVGFGRRARSLMSEEGRFTFDQLMPVTKEFDMVGERHVKIFAGLGTHNNFANPGRHIAPRSESILDSACDVNGTGGSSSAAPPDKGHRRRHLAFIWFMKTLFGVIPLPLLPLIGTISFALEALRYDDPVESTHGQDNPSEEAPPSEFEAMIIAPTQTLDELGLPSEQAWQIEDADLVNGQIWWPPPLGPANGYRGAWGVTCAEDPFDARSGMAFPDARAKLIESLAILLEGE